MKPLAKKGLNIEIIEFSDYVVPNRALADGDLNANSFQHQPYLDKQIAGSRLRDLVGDRQDRQPRWASIPKEVKGWT